MKGTPLEIEIVWHSDETKKMADAGMEYNVDECIYKTVTFYKIDLILPYEWDKDHNFSKIYAGGEYWITPYTYEELKSIIEKSNPQDK